MSIIIIYRYLIVFIPKFLRFSYPLLPPPDETAPKSPWTTSRPRPRRPSTRAVRKVPVPLAAVAPPGYGETMGNPDPEKMLLTAKHIFHNISHNDC